MIKALDLAPKVEGLYAPEKRRAWRGHHTPLQFSEEDRKLARDLVAIGRQMLIEAKIRTRRIPPRLAPDLAEMEIGVKGKDDV
jgi:hypothetical protein